MPITGLRNLCTPSLIYLVVSLAAITVLLVQNYGNTNVFCLGEYTCQVSSTSLILIIKIIYVLFWTWVLNLICRAGATPLAWILVIAPFILFFLLLIAFTRLEPKLTV